MQIGRGGFSGNQSIGLFSFEVGSDDDDGGRCLQYSDNSKDDLGTPAKVSRAFGVMAALMTGFAMVGLVLVQFCLSRCVKLLWLVIRILFIASLISQNLTFTIFGIEDCTDEVLDLECTLGAAGIIASLNTMVLVALIVLSWLASAPERPMLLVKLNKDEKLESSKDKSVSASATAEKKSASSSASSSANPKNDFKESKKVSVVEGPNGERTITEEITHADGSKTITETIETTRDVEIGFNQPVVPSRKPYAGRYGER